jgi:hypothetical protein
MIRFTDLPVPKPVDAKPITSTAQLIASTPEPLPTTLSAPKVDRLAAARASMIEIGTPPIEPKPLVDTTKRRGGRQKLAGEAADAPKEVERTRKRERTAVRRAAAKAHTASKAL